LQNEWNDEGAKVLANYLAFERVPVTEKVCLCTGPFPQSLQAVLALPGALVWPRFDVLENTLADFVTYHPKTFLGVLLNQTVIPPFQHLQFQRVAKREMNH
jgi:hypothetical protein